ncbi:MAG: hypothetical protein H6732_15900 [Alphaproteobacteria bacterium]|nr:hypothetical protein [Alphaproteobacteria bacterium]
MAEHAPPDADAPDGSPARWRGPAVAALAYLVVQLLALTTRAYAHLHYDEGMTPATGHALAWGRWSDVWSLIDLPHCGGCVVYATGAQAVFAVLPDVILTWKLVPLSLSCLAVACLYRVVADLGGAWAGALATWLMAFPPGELAAAQVVSWGNHLEGGLLCWVVLAALPSGAPSPRRALGAGALAGLAVAFVPTALVAPLVVLPWLALRRGRREAGAFAAGMVTLPLFRLVQGLLGPAWVGLVAVPPTSVASSVDPVRQLRLLTSLPQLGPIFGGLESLWWPWDGAVFAAAAAVALGVAVVAGRGRAELVVGLPLAWLAIYAVAPWRLGTLAGLGGERLVLFRYAVPFLGWLPGVIALAAALLVRRGHRGAALALALAAALPGTVERTRLVATGLGTSLPWLVTQPASTWVWFRRTPMRQNEAIVARWQCPDDAPACRFTQAVAAGRARFEDHRDAGCRLRAHAPPPPDADAALITGFLDAWVLACVTADDRVPDLLAEAEAWRARGGTDPALARLVVATVGAAWADRVLGEIFVWPGLDWTRLDLHPHGEALAWARGRAASFELDRTDGPPDDLPAVYAPWWALGHAQLAALREPLPAAWLAEADCPVRAGTDLGARLAHERTWWGLLDDEVVTALRTAVAACDADRRP